MSIKVDKDSKDSTPKYIVISGGVISGVGKGIITASIGKLLQKRDFTVTALKIDPYINVDAGTLRPTEHGEVWVTHDGGETDQDLGNYERFLNIELSKKNSITTGQIYMSVIEKERNGDYNGETVQLIPHITDEIKDRIMQAGKDYDFVLIEIGGICGDFDNIPFLSAVKALETVVGKQNVLYCLVSYMVIPSHLQEMKTKPTQTAIQSLMEKGIIPDIILCRGKTSLDVPRKKKIEQYVNIKSEYIISVPDVDNIYKVPLILESEDLGEKILKKVGLESKKKPDWSAWSKLINPSEHIKRETYSIAIVCKYLVVGEYNMTDSYVSVSEALKHVSYHFGINILTKWIDANILNDENINQLKRYDGVLVPGGFGSSGIEGKIKAIQFVRENNIPFLGLCYGLQLAIVEFARNVCDMKDAHTTEVDKKTKYPVVAMLEQQRKISKRGGTMRLGACPCKLIKGTKVYKLYEKYRLCDDDIIYERHRHRYEVNPKYVELLEKNGMIFSGSFDNETDEINQKLMEFIELPDDKHRFFVATQAHPEFTSRVESPNPLFVGFIEAITRTASNKTDDLILS
jgi:CTP synthase